MAYDYDYVDPKFDNPSLNKCPSCGALFDGTTCPICKTVCPDRRLAPDYAEYVRRCEKKKSRRRFSLRAHHSTYAITGIVCGIASILLAGVGMYLPIGLGVLAIDMFFMDRRLGRPSVLAVIGLICGIIGLLLRAVPLLFVYLLPLFG